MGDLYWKGVYTSRLLTQEFNTTICKHVNFNFPVGRVLGNMDSTNCAYYWCSRQKTKREVGSTLQTLLQVLRFPVGHTTPRLRGRRRRPCRRRRLTPPSSGTVPHVVVVIVAGLVGLVALVAVNTVARAVTGRVQTPNNVAAKASRQGTSQS